jgi:hypothetical protein
MMVKSFPVFDCDRHIVGPHEIWDEYVPGKVRALVKTQFHFHTDTDLLCISGRVVPAVRKRSNAAEVGWPRGPLWVGDSSLSAADGRPGGLHLG